MLKINAGCGPLWMPGYVNCDMSTLEELAVQARFVGMPEAPGPGVEFVQCDLTVAPWPWDDGCAEKVMASNVLEHLDDQGLSVFLGEALRVLCAGGYMEGGVPDIERIVAYAVSGEDWSWEPDWALGGHYETRAYNALQNMAHGWGHRQVFTRGMLEERLTRAGFAAEVTPSGYHGLIFKATKTEEAT